MVILASVAPLCRHFLQGAPIDYFAVFDFFGWSVWFLPTLFFCVATFLLVGCVLDLTKTMNKVICLVAALIAVPFSIEANKYGFSSFLHCLQIFPAAFSFFMLGSILKPQIAKLEHIQTEVTGIVAIISMCVCVVIANINEPVTFYRNDYGNLFMFYSSALLGCFSVLFFTTFLTSSKLLTYVGKNCIAFYAWNGVIAWGSQNVVTQLLSSLLPANSVTLVAFASFAIALPVLYLIVKLTMRCMPWIYGLARH